MAHFTVRGRWKPLLSGDGLSVWLDGKDPCHNFKALGGGGGGGGGGVVQLQNRRFRGRRSTTTMYANSSSTSSSSSRSNKSSSNSGSSVNSEDGVLQEILEDSEYERDELASFRGLVLDISYRPVNVVCWKRAICLEFMEKADVLEYYEQTVNSPSGSFYIPAVLRVPHLLQVVKRRRVKKSLSRKNILLRDNFMCQYCSVRENLTIDHVLPIARGGEWTWENLVTACAKCNSRKGQKTLEEANMTLMSIPKVPKDYDILAIPLTNIAIKMLKARKGTPEEWRQYLSKPSTKL